MAGVLSRELSDQLDQVPPSDIMEYAKSRNITLEPPEDPKTRSAAWIIIVVFIAVIAVISGVAAFLQFNKTGTPGVEFFTSITTLCLGGILGLIVPSK